MMSRVLIILAAVLMLAAAGAVEIARSGKSANKQQIQGAKEKLAAISLAFGDWNGTETKYDEKQLEQAEADAFISRVYQHKNSKEKIEVLIIAGNPKAIGAHDPQVCYAAQGYQQKRDPISRSVESADGKRDTFWSAPFDGDSASGSIKVHWGWTINGQWVASNSPRIDFAREPLLYKMYIHRATNVDKADTKDDLSEEFLKVFLPEVRRSFAQSSAE